MQPETAKAKSTRGVNHRVSVVRPPTPLPRSLCGNVMVHDASVVRRRQHHHSVLVTTRVLQSWDDNLSVTAWRHPDLQQGKAITLHQPAQGHEDAHDDVPKHELHVHDLHARQSEHEIDMKYGGQLEVMEDEEQMTHPCRLLTTSNDQAQRTDQVPL
ncbi:hypothetical protein FI667_g7969, partial [Globisporangium splendens]